MLQLLRKIAFPFSLIYALIVLIRNFLFNIGVFKSKSFQTPVLCVGNLSVGGTGKTPMIEYLIRVLEDYHVAVLSRGYKRKSKGFLMADPNSKVEDLGDEPFQMYKKFPQITLVVDSNRRRGISQLESTVKPDIILLDDAFQHRKVKPKFSILLTAHDNLYVEDWYLPTGNLRDGKLEAKRADLIVVTKCPEGFSEKDRGKILKKLNPKQNQNVLFSKLVYSDTIKENGNKAMPLLDLQNKKVALVTGIASPGPLLKYLKSKKIDFEHFEYPDHHNFTEGEIRSFENSEIVLTTEKDYVRLEGRMKNLYYLEVAHGFDSKDHEILVQAVKGLI
ncbi:tetraacyldisaccharide 4'-kinase [Flagellimonas nanhaiensis]|uniref:Tetraacyldisaccharide 4'-kinase n=1 Tax=Flagellimonas nanhaiensis TaxID=2292706 RepID=A0A371JM17_9FLAO|nr:tetraacyldisaccharide 4'-kinase [Allomuricauda nanhaiensis]RDY58116.1 tetraacyldisaccharide 4'-kinase [Allomuricauda nanhaiensis]